MRPTTEDLKLFASLAGNVPKLREYLQRQLSSYVEILLQQKGADEFRNAQGRAAVYQELLNLLDTAGPALVKLEGRTPPLMGRPPHPESF